MTNTQLNCNFTVYDRNGDRIGQKTVTDASNYLNGWFVRPRGIVPAVPLSSALAVKKVKSGCGMLAEGSLGYACLNSNDPQNHNFVTFMSSSIAKGHGTSITPDNFEKAMVQVAVRKAIKPTWLNDRDQYQIPHTEPDASFVYDCVVLNLFSGHNQTSEFTADYEGKRWLICNHFFPFSLHLVRTEGPQTLAFQRQAAAGEETFVHRWLVQNDNCEYEAEAVQRIATDYYELFYQNWANVNRKKWKIEGVRPGFYQIRNAMKDAQIGEDLYRELTDAVKRLQAKIVERTYKLGFLEPEMLVEESAGG